MNTYQINETTVLGDNVKTYLNVTISNGTESKTFNHEVESCDEAVIASVLQSLADEVWPLTAEAYATQEQPN